MKALIAWTVLAVTLLCGCTRPAGSDGLPPAGAAAVQEGTGIRFTLAGYAGAERPRLRVTSADGRDWSAGLGKLERSGEVMSVRLPGQRGLARLAAEQLDYEWILPDGTRAAGSILYRDPRFPDLNWRITRTDQLLIYHVRPLGQSYAEAWSGLLSQVTEWTGLSYDGPLVIWVFPDLDTLNRWARSGPEYTVAGLWHGDISRLILYDEAGSTERNTIILHELVHAVSPGRGPAWFEEGIANLLDARYELSVAGNQARGWQHRLELLRRLQQTARRRPIATAETDRLEPGLDPYTLGASVWLFVKRHHGEAGVQRFLREGGQESGIKGALESLFGKELPAVWADWNAYLQSPALLQDWETP